jgi:hypothetical protein
MEYMFGSGLLWGTPQQDASGNAISNPTPVLFGTMQDVSVDMSFDLKQLYGQNQFPVALGRGKGKIDCKAHIASINGAMLNSIFFGQTLTSAGVSDFHDNTGTAIPGTPFAITPTVPSSGTWAADLGVRKADGTLMTRVASAPATGQYMVSAGVYTFAAADTTIVVFIDYQYTFTSTTSKTSNVSNLLMGYAPAFRCDLLMPYGGKNLILTLYWCIGSKLSLATKLDDFTVPEFDFAAAANPNTGQVLTWGTSE